MKLWLKISLICIAVLLLTVGACSTLLLINSQDKVLAITIESTKKELSNFKASFTSMVSYYGKPELDPITKHSLINYCFRTNAQDTSVLLSDTETLYSNLAFNPQEYLPDSALNQGKHYLGAIAGRKLLIVGEKVNLLSENYTMFLTRDISDVYKNITQLIIQFSVISILCILVGIALIILLVWLATKPLKSLGDSARRIAQGEYSERASAASKDEIGNLAKDFNTMAEAVQAQFEEQKEVMQRQQLFIGGLTHEFKTPLTSVIGHAETLLSTNMPKEVVENSLTHIYEQCKWLERLTQKLLKLVTFNEEINLKPESVRKLLDAVMESTQETLQNRGMSLKIQCNIAKLPLDFDLMLSLLINLVDNASKASQKGQTVKINAHDHTIEVTDQGVGIPKEELTRILEPFYMVDKSRSKKMGGSGLGLALAKKIADAHGAELSIESASGFGTTVKVIFNDNK